MTSQHPHGVAQRRGRRERLAEIPHLQASEITRYINQWGYPVSEVTTACGDTIASTLVTRQPDRVRCERCRTATEGA